MGLLTKPGNNVKYGGEVQDYICFILQDHVPIIYWSFLSIGILSSLFMSLTA